MRIAGHVVLDVANRRALSEDVARAVQDVEFIGSMEEAPHLRVMILDPDDDLLRSRLMVRRSIRELGSPEAFTLRPIDLVYRGIPYRLTDADRAGAFTALEFEHRAVAYMRQHDKPISASRAGTTRALFIRRQVREAGSTKAAPHRLSFWAPELRKRQPIAALDEENLSDRAEPDRDVSELREGARAFRGLTIKGAKINTEQRRHIAISLTVAEEVKAGPKATLAMLVAGIGESGFTAVMNMEGSPYGGVFQGNVGGGVFEIGDTEGMARCFLLGGKGFNEGGAIKLARENPGITPGEIATRVETSGKPGSFYEQHREEAEAIMAAGPGVSTISGGGGSYVKQYRFRRDKGEDGWESTGRLAQEVNRRRFVTIVGNKQDVFIYAGDPDLIKLRPQASFHPDDAHSFDYGLTMGKTARTARVQFRTGEMELAWGLPVMVEGGGPVGGKWLVWDWRARSGSPLVDVELRQPARVLPEPASERVQRTQADVSGVGPRADLKGLRGATPKQIIDDIVLPISRDAGVKRTVAENDASNASHGPTISGGLSDHQGPPEDRWAADMSNGSSPTKEMDRLARELAEAFSIPWSGSGAVSVSHHGFRFQMIYRSNVGGNHYNHVHFGVERLGAG